jgi:hypothetical protein
MNEMKDVALQPWLASTQDRAPAGLRCAIGRSAIGK